MAECYSYETSNKATDAMFLILELLRIMCFGLAAAPCLNDRQGLLMTNGWSTAG